MLKESGQHEMDPFCRRSSPVIAKDVFEAADSLLCAVTMLQNHCEMQMYFVANGLLDNGKQVLELYAADDFVRVVDATTKTAVLFQKVQDWWVLDHPPALDPSCTSVVGSLLLKAAALGACHETFIGAEPNGIGPEDYAAMGRFIALSELYTGSNYSTALECEASAMARRPAPSLGMILRKNVGPVASQVYRDSLVREAKSLVRDRLPAEWHVRSRTGRHELFADLWKERFGETPPDVRQLIKQQHATLEDLLKKERLTVPDMKGIILAILAGTAMKGTVLAKRLGELTRKKVLVNYLYTRWGLNDLVATKEVVSDPKIGYWSRLAPPPEIIRTSKKLRAKN